MKQFLKEFLPSPVKAKLKKVKRNFDFALLRLMARSKLASTFFYTFLSKSFWREHQAVAFGRLLYEFDDRSRKGSQYLLRRNIHRLEKGLIMKPRRSIFALDYITETVGTFSQRVNESAHLNGDFDTEEILWAEDVLNAYFSVVGSHPVIESAKQDFNQVANLMPAQRLETNVIRAPYKRDLKQPSPVTYEKLLALAERRRSVRWFLQKSVPRDLIDKAILVAALSPSACNRQPFIFRIFDAKSTIKAHEVASLAGGTLGFYQNFPALAVVVGRQRAYFSERDRHLIYIDGSLASMSFVYALETLGLSSCCINWPDVEQKERKMAKLLNLQPDERIVMLIAIGYPDSEEMVPFSAKKMLHNLRRYD